MRGLWRGLAGVAVALGLVLFPVFDAMAAVQGLEGTIEVGDLVAYQLTGIKRGDRISAHLQGVSGNLNPVVALVAAPFDAVIFNMQDKRASQGLMINVDSNGTIWYMERFSGYLQAPDMDFRQIPFDYQNFYIHIGLIYASERYTFVPNLNKNKISDHIGAEEWEIVRGPSWVPGW